RGSHWIYTNAGGTIKKQDAYVDSWGGSGTTCINSPSTAGTIQAAAVSSCPDLTHAEWALAASNMGATQALSNAGGTGCLQFTLSGNTSGSVPFYVGEPVDFHGTDTNATPQLRMFGL